MDVSLATLVIHNGNGNFLVQSEVLSNRFSELFLPSYLLQQG